MTGFAGEFRSIYFWRYCLQMLAVLPANGREGFAELV